MSPKLVFIFCVIVTLLAAPVQAGAEPATITNLLEPWNKAGAPGAAVSVTLDGEVVGEWVVGSADIEHSAKVTIDTPFHAASLSKQVTAFAIVLLEQDGKLSIDDPVSTYIPEIEASGTATLRQLMTHTAGLREQWTLLAAAGWRSEDLVTHEQSLAMVLRQRRGNTSPGEVYEYSNSGYTLLAEVVRRVSGKSLAAFCQERIFSPLGMNQTQFVDDIGVVIPGRAVSYRMVRGAYARQVLNYATPGATGLTTTVGDLGLWGINLETGTIGGPTAVSRMREQGVLADGTVNAYALGQERRLWRGLDTWSHGGRDAGFRSFLLRVPGENLTVSVLSNAADFDTAKVAFEAAQTYLAGRAGWAAEPAEDETPPTAVQLAAYAGTYELFPGLNFEITTDGQRLMFAPLGGAPNPLPAITATRFQLDAKTDLSIEFPTSAPVNGFQYRIGLHGALPARRITLEPFAPDLQALEPFVGRYYSPELASEYELRVIGGKLTAHHPRLAPIGLTAYQPDTFSSPASFFQKLVFERNEVGAVTGFQMSGAVANNIRFERRTDTLQSEGRNAVR